MRLRRTLTFVAIQSVAILVLLEIALRIVAPCSAAVRSRLAVPQDALDFSGVSSTEELLKRSVLGFHPYERRAGFVSNSRGFRTREYAIPKPAGTYRVVALGDSFTYASGGVPWADLWTTQLERLLDPGDTRTVEVLNLGVPSVGPSFVHRLWQLEGARLDPDLVLVGLFVGNDFTEERWAPAAGWWPSLARASHVTRLARWLIRGSASNVSVPYRPATRSVVTNDVPDGGFPIHEYTERFATRSPPLERGELIAVESHAMAIVDRARPDVFEVLLAQVTRILLALDSEVTAAGAECVVVIMPDRYQLIDADRSEALARMGLAAGDVDVELPQRRLSEALTRAGVRHLDLLPAFRAHTTPARLYNRGDTHWSPEGNALAAEQIAAFLQP